jgi:hypothetical protein
MGLMGSRAITSEKWKVCETRAFSFQCELFTFNFSSVMDGTDISEWIHNSDRSTTRPAGLGYLIGYRILEANHKRMPDKQKAIAEMLAIREPVAILRDSGYTP